MFREYLSNMLNGRTIVLPKGFMDHGRSPFLPSMTFEVTLNVVRGKGMIFLYGSWYCLSDNPSITIPADPEPTRTYCVIADHSDGLEFTITGNVTAENTWALIWGRTEVQRKHGVCDAVCVRMSGYAARSDFRDDSEGLRRLGRPRRTYSS